MKNKSLKPTPEKPISLRLSIHSTTSDSFGVTGRAHLGFNKKTERIKPLKQKK